MIKAEKPIKKYIINSKNLAEIMGVSTRSLLNWKKLGMPNLPQGKFELASVFSWYVKRKNDAEENTTETQELRKSQEKYWEAKASREQTKNAIERSDSILFSDITSELFEAGRIIKEGLTGMIESLAPELAGITDMHNVKQVLTSSIHNTLANFNVALKGIEDKKND